VIDSMKARKAETLVHEEVSRFLRDREVRHGVPVLARLRQRGDQIAQAEVERTLALGPRGSRTSSEGRTDRFVVLRTRCR
jgi:glutamyl-tRNA reductase